MRPLHRTTLQLLPAANAYPNTCSNPCPYYASTAEFGCLQPICIQLLAATHALTAPILLSLVACSQNKVDIGYPLSFAILPWLGCWGKRGPEIPQLCQLQHHKVHSS
eukprot:735025-Pelagomonas_calceolata.AAC.2